MQGRKKIKLVQLFTEMNLTVIISDVDTVWMRNPFEYFKRYPEADILTSSDFVSWTYGDEGLEDGRRAGSAYNIGIMMFSPKSASFAAEWVEKIEADDKYWDQNAFNECEPHVQLPCLWAFPKHRALAWSHPGLVPMAAATQHMLQMRACKPLCCAPDECRLLVHSPQPLAVPLGCTRKQGRPKCNALI